MYNSHYFLRLEDTFGTKIHIKYTLRSIKRNKK